MASEITSTQTASPVKIQQRFNLDRVVSQPDMRPKTSAIEFSNSVMGKKGLSKIEGQPAEEKKLASELLDAKTKEAENKELDKKIAQLNDYTQKINREIRFSVDEETDRTVIKVIDSETDEVIRQIPSEEILRIAESLEKFSGILLQEQA